ncbi:MAG TPA: hypothetical protein VK734_21580 [Bradyrhizobium sp.]|jgi:hypothetical protein|nr:hypothetical protein [Bradyrhizobium sp.]
MIARNHIRAARYRALALTEKDQARANLLDRLAGEAEHGVLCTVRHLRLVYSAEGATLAPSIDASSEFNSAVAAPMI